eukprot:6208048-Pleurochrysis_carterae.AAC.2
MLDNKLLYVDNSSTTEPRPSHAKITRIFNIYIPSIDPSANTKLMLARCGLLPVSTLLGLRAQGQRCMIGIM